MQARVVVFRSMPINVGPLQQTYPFLQPADPLKSKSRLEISTPTLGEAAAGHFVSTSAMQGDIIANDDVLISAPFKCRELVT